MFFTTKDNGDYNKIIRASRLQFDVCGKNLFAMLCFNFIICKIFGKIIGKHSITKIDHFLWNCS